MLETYQKLAAHYDACLEAHGDTAKGADWPNQHDRTTRFAVMLDVLANDDSPHIELLDFACGTGDLLRHIREIHPGRSTRIRYHGADISTDAIAMARGKFADASFTRIDLLTAPDEDVAALAADYCVINGLFTVKTGLSDTDMWTFMTRVVSRLWGIVRKGIAFNVMSKHVDYERDDLFHVSFDRLAEFMHALAGRRIAFRADYGLYEYTCLAFKQSPRPAVALHAAPAARINGAAPTGISPRSSVAAVCRPLLPATARLRPYLESIDRRRWYSNWGRLANELEARLANHFGLADGTCVSASSGTDALMAALLAIGGRATPERPYCLIPSYTFVASAAAALGAGYTPYFLDIEPDTLTLTPAAVLSHPALARAGAILVVAPYGRSLDVAAWSRLSRSIGVPVLIDAAAGFDSIAAKRLTVTDNVPVVVSLHATKVFGTGEGGLILCGDADLAQRCRRALNFGFLGDRRALVTGVNGKMSEYHAAVGLAELDGWQDKRAAFMRVGHAYASAANRNGLNKSIWAESDWASSYALYMARSITDAESASARLSIAGIEHRLWYGHGVHREAAYAQFPADPMPVTTDLSARLIGLPVAIDLADDDIDYVVGVLADTASSAPTPPSSVA